jgi:hypothetical protein
MQRFGWSKLFTGLVWLALGFCAVAWGMHLRAGGASGNAELPPAGPGAQSRIQPDFDAMVRALNAGAVAPAIAAAPAAPPAASRFQVRGVALSVARSVALLAVDGQGARPYAVDAEVVDGWRVRSVSTRTVVLGKRGEERGIELGVPQPVQ